MKILILNVYQSFIDLVCFSFNKILLERANSIQWNKFNNIVKEI